MKYEILTDKDNNIIGAGAPENNIKSTFLELDNIDYEKLHFSKLINGEIIFDEKKYKTEKLKKEINNLKDELSKTDYQAIKYSEGWFTEEEYAPIKAKRESLREKIRVLESDK